MYLYWQLIKATCAVCKGLLIFFKKNSLGVATFKNSCIFASAMETLLFI